MRPASNDLVGAANCAGDRAANPDGLRSISRKQFAITILGSAAHVVSTMAAVTANAVSDNARVGIAFANREPWLRNRYSARSLATLPPASRPPLPSSTMTPFGKRFGRMLQLS